MNNNFTPEQIADIKEREAKGLQALKDLQLTPAAIIQKANIGNDGFIDQVTPYLRDTKFAPIPSTNPEVNPDAV